MFLTSPNLVGVKHGFFTRTGGVSEGIYASLNCGWGSGDNQNNIIENRRRVAGALGAPADNLCSLYQVHGAEVVTVNEPWARDRLPKADAMVTTRKSIALGILTADCVPVLFADAQAGVIGAAHAGWRGALAGVLARTVDAMCAEGATLPCISAAIGPCIAQPSYEVGQEFYDTLLQENAGNAGLFIAAAQNGHWRFDIKAYVRGKLAAAGITAINLLENDTYIEEDSFFSFRRTTHAREKANNNNIDYGRQVSAIMLT